VQQAAPTATGKLKHKHEHQDDCEATSSKDIHAESGDCLHHYTDTGEPHFSMLTMLQELKGKRSSVIHETGRSMGPYLRLRTLEALSSQAPANPSRPSESRNNKPPVLSQENKIWQQE
jgi:hypothetical protein